MRQVISLYGKCVRILKEFMVNLKVPNLYCPLHEVNVEDQKSFKYDNNDWKYLFDKCTEPNRYTSLLSTE
jgi:hypothetical protein